MDFSEVSCDIDVLIIGTTNLAEYSALRADPLSKALRSRIRKIDVPYLLNYQDEEKIYNRGLRMARRYHRIAPHTTEMAALWAVMSRVQKTELTHSTDVSEETRQVLGKLTPVAKTLLYAGEYPPLFTGKERQQLTREVRRRLRNEFPDEGMDGIPTRILQNLFADLCEDDKSECITPFSVFKLLDQVVEQGPVNYDFLARQRDDSYHDFRGFTTVLRMRYDEIISAEIENSIINVDNSEIEGRIREYLKHVTAYNRKEKVRNEMTGRDMDPDEKLMKRIEALMEVEDSERDFYRFKMVSRLTNALTGGTGHIKAGDTGVAHIDFYEVYSDVFKAIHRSLYREKRDKINWSNVKRDLEKHSSRESLDRTVEKEGKADHLPALTLLDNMEKTYGYAYECAKPIVLYFIERRLGAR
jgi:serine protein kinase